MSITEESQEGQRVRQTTLIFLGLSHLIYEEASIRSQVLLPTQ